MLFGYLYILFGEMSNQVPCLFLKLDCSLLFVYFLSLLTFNSLYILDTKPCKWFVCAFSYSVVCLYFFESILWCRKGFNLGKVQFICFFFGHHASGVMSKKCLSTPRSQRFTSTFPSFIVLVLTFNSLIHSEIIFVLFMR